MRMSDLSSDVCSSDLGAVGDDRHQEQQARAEAEPAPPALPGLPASEWILTHLLLLPAPRLDFAHHAEADPPVGAVHARGRAPRRARLGRRAGPGATPHHPRPAPRIEPGARTSSG